VWRRVSAERITITAIIPAYNEAERIGAAIESVLAQTYPAAEILVIDDGSSDDTAAIAALYGVRVVTQRNAGISAARNRAFAGATGDWIALLDADDLWLPERLEWLARASAAHPQIGFGFSDYTVEENGIANAPSNLGRTPQYHAARGKPNAIGIYAIPHARLCEALAVGNFLGTSTVFVRRELVTRHDLRFDETLPLRTADYQVSEDVEWYLRVLKWTDALAIERVLARYVRRSDSQAENYGRVRYGDVKLGERVRAVPDAYEPGAPAAFAAMRRHHLRHAARIHMRAAEFASARARLAEAQRERFVASDALWLAAATTLDCAAGRTATRATRAAWQRSIRPMLRSFARAAARK
jgi:glycosyltransferase involved in cell wall biosynthesis